MNGEENPAPLARFAATQGRLDAGQLTLKISGTQGGAVADAFAVGSGLGMGRDALPTQTFGVDGGARASVRPAVGVETTVYIQALDYELSGREVGGGEPVCLRLISPSGVSANVPLRARTARASSHRALAGGGRTRARRPRTATPSSGHPRAWRRRRGRAPARLPPPAPARRASPASGAFSVEARDARGNRLVAGGASLTLQVQVPGSEPTRGAVLDQGDGTYACSYAVDVAGPYLLVLASQSSRLALEGACRAGPADPAKCRVDAAELKRLTAGARGVARITRYDRFGNVVPAGPDLLPFRVEVAGVGPAEMETVEAGDGACEVRFEARVAGRYSLKVFSGHGASVPVSGSPFDAVVLPGQAASSSCVARLEGTKVHGPGVTAASRRAAGRAHAGARPPARHRLGGGRRSRWRRPTAGGDVRGARARKKTAGRFRLARHRSRRCPARAHGLAHGRRPPSRVAKATRVVPGVVDSDAAVWRAEADTAALTSQLVGSRPRWTGTAPCRSCARAALGMQREADSPCQRLAKYEEAAAVVMEAAEAGVD